MSSEERNFSRSNPYNPQLNCAINPTTVGTGLDQRSVWPETSSYIRREGPRRQRAFRRVRNPNQWSPPACEVRNSPRDIAEMDRQYYTSEIGPIPRNVMRALPAMQELNRATARVRRIQRDAGINDLAPLQQLEATFRAAIEDDWYRGEIARRSNNAAQARRVAELNFRTTGEYGVDTLEHGFEPGTQLRVPTIPEHAYLRNAYPQCHI